MILSCHVCNLIPPTVITNTFCCEKRLNKVNTRQMRVWNNCVVRKISRNDGYFVLFGASKDVLNYVIACDLGGNIRQNVDSFLSSVINIILKDFLPIQYHVNKLYFKQNN